jgi:hypothetical protein
MCFRRLAVWTAMLTVLSTAQAAEPVVEVRVKSIDALVPRIEYVAGVIGQAEEAKGLVALAKTMTKPDTGLLGVDPTREFGLYASVVPNLLDSPVVLMIPVKDPVAFAGLLTDQLNLKPGKEEDGTFGVEVPGLPKKVYYRFVHDYAYVTLGDPKNVAVAAVVPPSKFFAAKTNAVLTATVHVDRIPEEVKRVALGQLEQYIEQGKKEEAKRPPSPEDRLVHYFGDRQFDAVKSVFSDGKSITLTVSVEPKTDDLGVEIALTPKPDTTLAKVLKVHGDRPSLAVSRLKDDAAFAMLFNFDLPDETLPAFGLAVDDLLANAVAKASSSLKEFSKSLTAAVALTLKAGDIDFGMVVSIPDAQGQTRAAWAMKVRDGRAIEKSFEQLLPHVPKTLAKVTPNVRRDGDTTWHKWDILEDGDKVAKIAGSSTGWAAVRNDLILFGVGKEESFRATLDREPMPAPLVWIEFSALAVCQIDMLGATEDERRKSAAAIKDVFGDDPSTKRDRLVFAVETGPELKIRLTTKGATIRLFSRMLAK